MLSRKKLGFGITGFLLLAVIYYFTTGSAQLTEEMKIRVNTELTMIQQNGFAIQEREVKEKEEHFVLSFDDPVKITEFFKQQGNEISLEEVKTLTGFKIGVDLQYLHNTYSALSVDMYPLNLPPALGKDQDLDEEDKAIIEQLNNMLKRKALLVHIDFNKLLSSFKGHIKDIHETFKAETAIKIDLEGATFDGTIQNDRLYTLVQNIKNITVSSGDSLNIVLKGLKSNYQLTGNSIYDSSYNYTVDTIEVSGKEASDTFSVSINNIKGDNKTSSKNNLLSNKITLHVSDIEIIDNDQKTKLIDNTFSFNIENLDINILKQLETVNVDDDAEINRLVQALISKGITMEIPSFQIKKLGYKGKNIDGFSLTSSFQIDRSADLTAIQSNPFSTLSMINTKTKIILSDALFTLIAQQPKAMMLAMIIQPKVINGKKVYEIELKNGKLTVNGKSML